MESFPLEQIINQYVQLDPPTSNGWRAVLCKVCNDSGRKGKRAGFKFDIGDVVGYHCFNCSHATKYDPTISETMPAKMVQVLESFDIPQEQWQQVLFASLAYRREHSNLITEIKPRLDIEPTIIPLPKHFYSLAEASPDDKWAQVAKYYLDGRGIDSTQYPFMLAHKTGVPALDRWFKRIIIPIYKDSKLIFYIGRDLTETHQKKYLTPSFAKEKVIYGFDRLFEKISTPIYIVEGWFDAFVIDGIALLGNEISEAQSIWLNKSHREKVYIPDRQGNGRMAAEQALKLGWSVSTPDVGDIKDMNEAVKKYGRLYVMKSIAEQTTADNFTAKSKLSVYCKYEEVNKNRSKKKDSQTS